MLPHSVVGGLHASAEMVVAEVQGLGRSHQFDPQDSPCVLQDLGGLEDGVHPHADEVFLVCGRRDRLHTGRCAQGALLHDQHVGGVLAEHHAGEHAGAPGQERGQADAERRVQQPVQSPLGKHRNHCDAGADHVHRHAHRRALEVGPGEDPVLVGQENRVVANAVEFDLHLLAGKRHLVPQGADDLGRGPHGVSVLDLDLHLAGDQVGSVQHPGQVGRAGDRPPEPPQFVQPAGVRLHVGQESFQGHGGSDLGLLDPAFGVMQQQGGDGGQQVGAVDGGQSVPGLQAGNRDAGGVHGGLRRNLPSFVETLSFAHQAEGDLAHGGEITTGANAPFLAHHRRDAGVEQCDVGQGDLRPASRVPLGLDVDTPQHRPANPLLGNRFSDAGGMVVDQVLLELPGLVVVQPDAGQFTDAGVDAVHHLAAGDPALQEGAAGPDPVQGAGRQFHGFAASCDPQKFFDGETGTVQNDRHPTLLAPLPGGGL